MAMQVEPEVVNVHEAKSSLSELLRRVEAGEEIVIGRAGEPVARLTRWSPPTRRLGRYAGQFEIPDDFDEPDWDTIEAIEQSKLFPE